jgi:hypothetical protein
MASLYRLSAAWASGRMGPLEHRSVVASRTRRAGYREGQVLARIALIAVILLGGGLALLWAAGQGAFGRHERPGEVTEHTRPPAALERSAAAVVRAAESIGVTRPKQVLFGDLHVHTTFSFDAFMLSLPVMQGEGAHPPADACDFARFCSALDFWSINDHAEAITARHWRETVESIRQCNAVGQDPGNPDMVAFLGWEWTQVGNMPDDHYGHKNVVLAGVGEEEVTARPIAAASTVRRAAGAVPPALRRGVLALLGGDRRYADLATYLAERDGVEICDEHAPVRELPIDCLETAETPADLFRKLDDWGLESIVIPHGTTWGFYTPPGSAWDKQLAGDMHDPDRQILLEIFSGHGNAEEYRDWRELAFDAEGHPVCPEPRPDYLPTCWRAGEIIRERCATEGAEAGECARRAETARRRAAEAGHQAFLTVPGARVDDWLDAGQCRDCVLPAFNHRPRGAAQYILAIRNFDEPGAARRFRFGFMSSSDNHFARPGTGYKEIFRGGNTESARARGDGPIARLFAGDPAEPAAESRPFDPHTARFVGFQLFEAERQASFFLTGGLVAVHANGRDRRAIWDALVRREVYGTSGPRILLWFDLLNPPGSRGEVQPMGSEVRMTEAPIFRARAVGSFEQLPGCPDYATAALDPERLAHLCKGECYNPSDRRRLITRIEVVRIRPQLRQDEPVARLIDDPWRTLFCEPDPVGCAVTFTDPEFTSGGRDAVYYVRAVEAPAPAINADALRCERDAEGACLRVRVCGAGSADFDDDCLAEHEPRAWSSPIFVDFQDG